MTGTILTKILPRPSGTIARVTISRPQKLNSLNGPLLSQIPQTFHDLETQNPDLRAVILTGEGEKAFIGGADITEMAGVRDPSESREFISSVRRACRSVRRFPAPVIARLNGYTLGAGLEIAAACDLRIASSNAVFGMPEVRIGIPSVVEAALLPNLIGWARARQLMMLGGNISAQEAREWGLVGKVVEQGELDGAVDSWVRELDMASPAAVRAQKFMMNDWEEMGGVEERIQTSVDWFERAWKTRAKDGLPEPASIMTRWMKEKAKKKGGS